MRRLHAMKLENYNSVSAYICEITNLTQQLADIGKVVEDEDIGFIMLNGLTEDYKPMVRALEASSKELSSQMVKDFLLGDEQRDEQNERLSAMWTRNNNRRRFNKSHPVYHKKEDDGKQNNNNKPIWKIMETKTTTKSQVAKVQQVRS
jgi:hypothetical protein